MLPALNTSTTRFSWRLRRILLISTWQSSGLWPPGSVLNAASQAWLVGLDLQQRFAAGGLYRLDGLDLGNASHWRCKAPPPNEVRAPATASPEFRFSLS